MSFNPFKFFTKTDKPDGICDYCKDRAALDGSKYCSHRCQSSAKDRDKALANASAKAKHRNSEPVKGRYETPGDNVPEPSQRPPERGLCEFCHKRPKNVEQNSKGQTVIYPYCGRTCATAATKPTYTPSVPTGPPDDAPLARTEIKFYDSNRPFYGFTNFSPHVVKYQGKDYPTSEHLFQAMKFIEDHPDIAERIRTGSPRPRYAFDEAHKNNSDVRPDWLYVRVSKMEEVLELKFQQNPDLMKQLLSTGRAILIEDAGANDAFWGNGPDGNGRNELGKALMRLRAKLTGDV